MSSLDRLLAKGKRALTYSAVGLASLIPLKEVNGQDTDKYLNPFVQPNQTTLYYGSGDVDGDGNVDWDDYYAMDSVQNDMSDVDGDGVASTIQDKATLEGHLRDNILLPSDWESQTKEGRDNWIKKVALIDSTNYIPLNSPEWKCTEYSIQFGIVNCRGYFNADLPSKYNDEHNGRLNSPGYCVAIYSENILGGGHDMNGFLTGDSALNFNDWNFIEPQTDSTNVKPEQESWNMPYNSEMWIYGIKKFDRETIIPFAIIGFNIDENGNNSLIYKHPELVLARDTTVNAIAGQLEIPSGYSLSQNYPNPFNSSTTIEYYLPAREHVRLNIYDIRGKTVKTLVDEVQGPGEYRTGWDGRSKEGNNVPSGVYLYQLKAGDYVGVGRMVYLK